jgi:hypothetical protein
VGEQLAANLQCGLGHLVGKPVWADADLEVEP